MMAQDSCRVAKLENGGQMPWFIVEWVPTSDGVRTRICEGWYGSKIAAQAACDWKNRA